MKAIPRRIISFCLVCALLAGLTPVCAQEAAPEILWTNYNNMKAEPGALKDYVYFELDRPCTVTEIETRHINPNTDAQGQIWLYAEDGSEYGPFAAWTGALSEGEMRADVFQVSYVDIALSPGRYAIGDSDSNTWAANAASNFWGLAQVRGYYLSPETESETAARRASTSGTPHVLDDANLFTDAERTEIERALIRAGQWMDAELVVATTRDAGGLSEGDYALSLFTEHDFGTGATRDSAMYLIDLDNKKIIIHSSGFLHELLSDGLAEEALAQSCLALVNSREYAASAMGFAEHMARLAGGNIDGQPRQSLQAGGRDAETVSFTAEDPVIKLDGLTVDFTNAGLHGEHTASAAKTEKLPAAEGGVEVVMAYELRLDGAEHTRFDHFIKVTLPKPQASMADTDYLTAPAWYDSETGEWYPALCDTSGGGLEVYTDHFSMLGLIRIEYDNLSRIPYVAADIAQLDRLMLRMNMLPDELYDLVRRPNQDDLISASLGFIGVTDSAASDSVTALTLGGKLTKETFDECSKRLGNIGLAVSVLKLAYDYIDQRDNNALLNSSIGILIDAFSGYAISALVTTPYAAPVIALVLGIQYAYNYEELHSISENINEWAKWNEIESMANEIITVTDNSIYYTDANRENGRFGFLYGAYDVNTHTFDENKTTAVEGGVTQYKAAGLENFVDGLRKEIQSNKNAGNDRYGEYKYDPNDIERITELYDRYIFDYGRAFFALEDGDLKLLSEKYARAYYGYEGDGAISKDDMNKAYKRLKEIQSYKNRGEVSELIKAEVSQKNLWIIRRLHNDYLYALRRSVIEELQDICKYLNTPVELAIEPSYLKTLKKSYEVESIYMKPVKNFNEKRFNKIYPFDVETGKCKDVTRFVAMVIADTGSVTVNCYPKGTKHKQSLEGNAIKKVYEGTAEQFIVPLVGSALSFDGVNTYALGKAETPAETPTDTDPIDFYGTYSGGLAQENGSESYTDSKFTVAGQKNGKSAYCVYHSRIGVHTMVSNFQIPVAFHGDSFSCESYQSDLGDAISIHGTITQSGKRRTVTGEFTITFKKKSDGSQKKAVACAFTHYCDD